MCVTFVVDPSLHLQDAMPHRPSPARRVAALAGCALALGGASVAFDAATAHGAVIGAQETLRPPARQPIDFPGRPYREGAPIPRGPVIVRRRVDMQPGERAGKLTFTCPVGFYGLTPGLAGVSEIGIAIDVRAYRRVHRRWTFRIYPAPRQFVKGPTADADVYLMCGSRRLAEEMVRRTRQAER
jgi:hypothetical protein